MKSDQSSRGEGRGSSLLLAVLLGLCLLLDSGCGSLAPSTPVVTSDPVCGAVLNRSRASRRVYGGRDYYFDSEECAKEFDAHPSAYAAVHLSRVGPR